MDEWKKVRLGDIATFSNGVNFGKDSYCQGVKLIGVSDFGNRLYPAYDELQEISTKVVRANDYLHEGDIVFVRSNGNKELVGRCMLITANQPSVTYSGFCIRARLNDLTLYNPLFFTYYFKNKEFRKAMSGTAVGANIQNLSQARLAQHKVLVPPLEVQNKIAAILCRYDDLIENYQKQIKLLEEAAQRLYAEWFVDLHFPGYENVQVVDGVPEGWKKKNLGDLASFQRGKTITKKEVVVGTVPVVAGGLEPAYYCNKSNTSNRVVTVSASGANAGFVRMYFEKVWASDCSYLDSDKTDCLSFIYCFLKDNRQVIANLQKGSAQPHVYAKDINALEMLVPPQYFLSQFENIGSRYFKEIGRLLRQLRLLTEARDRLLPKLMSGEIEV